METVTVIYLVFAMLSPVLYFVEPKIDYGPLKLILNTSNYIQIFTIVYLVCAGIYWLIKLVKEDKEEFYLLENEGLALLLMLSGLVYLKMFLLLIFSSISGFKFSEKVTFKIKHILILFLMLLVYINEVIPTYVILVIYSLALIKYYSEEINENDHYVLFVLTTILTNVNVLKQEYSLVIMFVILVSFWRHKLSIKDVSRLNTKLNSYEKVMTFYRKILSKTFVNVNLTFINHEEVALKKNKQRIKKNIGELEAPVSDILIMTLLFVMVLLVLEATWF